MHIGVKGSICIEKYYFLFPCQNLFLKNAFTGSENNNCSTAENIKYYQLTLFTAFLFEKHIKERTAHVMH